MYTIQPITDRKVWDDFVDAATPSTFLHAYAWGEVEEDMGKKIFRFGVFETGENQKKAEKLVAVFLVSVVRARRGDFLLCPHGPIFSKEISSAAISDIFSAIKGELVMIGKTENCDFIRICPILLDTPDHGRIFSELGLREAPIHVYTELSWILDITPSSEQLLSQMKKNTRYGIRKAERDGIVVRSSADPADIEVFWKVYSLTAERQKFVPYSKKYIASEFARFAEDDRARWFFAKYNDEIVSTALVIFGKNSAFYHHGASLHAHSAITPSEFLQWNIIQEAKARGCTRYNFWGVVPDEKMNHPWAGLSNFKKGFGGFAEKYVHAKDYPLTPQYMLTYVIETVRRWKRRV